MAKVTNLDVPGPFRRMWEKHFGRTAAEPREEARITTLPPVQALPPGGQAYSVTRALRAASDVWALHYRALTGFTLSPSLQRLYVEDARSGEFPHTRWLRASNHGYWREDYTDIPFAGFGTARTPLRRTNFTTVLDADNTMTLSRTVNYKREPLPQVDPERNLFGIRASTAIPGYAVRDPVFRPSGVWKFNYRRRILTPFAPLTWLTRAYMQSYGGNFYSDRSQYRGADGQIYHVLRRARSLVRPPYETERQVWWRMRSPPAVNPDCWWDHHAATRFHAYNVRVDDEIIYPTSHGIRHLPSPGQWDSLTIHPVTMYWRYHGRADWHEPLDGHCRQWDPDKDQMTAAGCPIETSGVSPEFWAPRTITEIRKPSLYYPRFYFRWND